MAITDSGILSLFVLLLAGNSGRRYETHAGKAAADINSLGVV